MSYIRDLGYDFIRFVATLLILVWHFYTSCKRLEYHIPNFVKNVVAHENSSFGTVGVALFFMLSGALLIHLYREDFDIKTFYKKRILRICLPHFVAFVFGFLIIYVSNADIIKASPIGIFISSLGMGFFPCSLIKINSIWVIGEWYTSVIIMLYIFFPLLRKLFLKNKLLVTIIIICIFVANLKFKVMSNPEGWASYSNGLMCFWIGMLLDQYINKLSQKFKPLTLAVTILFWFICPKIQIGCYNYIAMYLFSSLFFLSLYQIKATSKFTKYICKYNYEIYLVHHRIYLILMPALLTTNSNNLQIIVSFFVLSSLTLLISEALQKYCYKVQNSKAINKLFCVAN